MAQIQVSTGGQPAVSRARSARANRYFFPAVAGVLLVLTILGFGRFYTQGMAYPGREIAPPLKTVVMVHAIVMSAWMILLMVQPMLVLLRKTRIHMTLGKVGAVLAVLVIATGLWLAIRSVQVTPAEARIWGLPATEFFIVPLTAVFIFGGFVGLAIAYRKKPKIHRVMMILGTLAIMSAPISRIDLLNNLYIGTMWERLFGPFFMTLILTVVLVAIHAALTRTLDRLFAGGAIILIVLSLAIWQLAPTAAWAKVAALFV